MPFWLMVLTAGLCFLVGCMVGSFLNVCIWRVPRGQSIIRPPSHCPHCEHRIAVRDNIPLLSYLLLGARCRRCGETISPRYPAVEALTGTLAVAIFLVFGLTAQAVIFFILFCLLIVVSFVDLDRLMIPDKVTLPGIVLGLVVNTLVAPQSVLGFLFGALVGAAVLFAVAVLGELLFKKESMGGGDIKLAAMVGAFLGLKGVLMALFLAVLVGAIVGIVLMISGLRKRWEHIPFGPFIAAGTILVVFWGERIARAYQKIFLLS